MAAVLLKLLYLCISAVDVCKSLKCNDFTDFLGHVIPHIAMLFRSFAGYIKVKPKDDVSAEQFFSRFCKDFGYTASMATTANASTEGEGKATCQLLPVCIFRCYR